MIQASDRFLRVLSHQPVDRTPVWLMRQAGRYLPEYRAVRKQVKDFMGLCMNPELACEVTLQPLRRYELDAAILFQDILTLPSVMGLPLRFVEGEGPVFDETIHTLKDIEKLRTIEPERDCAFVGEEIKLITRELAGKLPLIGFCGSPWTVATYMVEGQGTKTFSKIRKMMYESPQVLHALLNKLAENSARYLEAQINAGVSCVMIFDTWGGILPYEAYKVFSLAYMEQIIRTLKKGFTKDTPVIVFTKAAAPWYADLAQSGASALGVDWTTPLSYVREQVGLKMVLQGNLDPFVLYAEDAVIEKEVARVLKESAGTPHIFNLGHGMLPDLSPEKVHLMIEALHRFSPLYHQQG